jgi:hypothetical protein
MLFLTAISTITVTELFCAGVTTAVTTYSIYRTGKKIKI